MLSISPKEKAIARDYLAILNPRSNKEEKDASTCTYAGQLASNKSYHGRKVIKIFGAFPRNTRP